MTGKKRAPRNRTITLTDEDRRVLRPRLVMPDKVTYETVNCTILGDCIEIADSLPRALEIGRAFLGCLWEARHGMPDRWPAVLRGLREGKSSAELFPDELYDGKALGSL